MTKSGFSQRLLCCGVQPSPIDAVESRNFGFTAADIGDYLFDVLARYDKSYESLEFMCGDNAAVNQSLCNLLTSKVGRQVPLIGCASHRLNLAVENIYDRTKNPSNYRLVEMVAELMIVLRTMKNCPKLYL